MLIQKLLSLVKHSHKKQTKHELKFKIGDCVSFKVPSLSGSIVDVRDIDEGEHKWQHIYLVRWNTKWKTREWDGKGWVIEQSSAWCTEESLQYTDPFRELIYQVTQ